MDKREKIKITGTSHYADNIKSLMFENAEYSLSNKELLDSYNDGDDIPEYVSSAKHVDLVPEPENKYDSNAVRCDIEGVKVGYVKRGSCSHVKNLLVSPDFKYVMIDKLIYGKVKHVYSDDNGKTHIEKREYESPVVHLFIATGTPSENVTPAPPAPPIPKKIEKKPKVSLPLLIALFILSIIFIFILPGLGIIGVIVTIVFIYKYLKEKERNDGTQ